MDYGEYFQYLKARLDVPRKEQEVNGHLQEILNKLEKESWKRFYEALQPQELPLVGFSTTGMIQHGDVELTD